MWAAAGYAHLVMDTRGQGSTWSVGDTPDHDTTGAPAHPGFMTRGILDPATRANDHLQRFHESGYHDHGCCLVLMGQHLGWLSDADLVSRR